MVYKGTAREFVVPAEASGDRRARRGRGVRHETGEAPGRARHRRVRHRMSDVRPARRLPATGWRRRGDPRSPPAHGHLPSRHLPHNLYIASHQTIHNFANNPQNENIHVV